MSAAGQVSQRGVDRRYAAAGVVEIFEQEDWQRRGVVAGPLMDDDDLATQCIARGDRDRRLTFPFAQNRQGVDE
jgi:hypothetical protein